MAISIRTSANLNKIIGTGVKFPVEFSENRQTELLELQTGIEKIHQSIRMLIGTRRGERYNNPEYGCFTGDTLIPLLNGTTIPIKELVNKECWIYGVLPDGTVKPSFSPGAVYKGNKEVIEIILDNNEVIKCTPDHKFMLRDGTYKEAKDLQENESLMPLYRQINKKGYEQTFNNKLQKFIPTHKLNHNPKNKNTVIHHKDFNKRNNDPTNLEELDNPERSGEGRAHARQLSKGNKWYNHKVLSIKLLEEKQDVYDLINSDTSNFALNAGVFVHNCDAKLYVFEPNDLLLRSLLYYTISDALQRWEKRITVTSITFQGTDEDTNIHPNQLNITINYIVNSTHQVGSYVYPFALGGMPYNELVIGKNASNLGINNLLGSSTR